MVLVDTGDHTLLKRQTSVRDLAGNLDSDDISDTKVDEKLNNGDTQMEIQTGKFDWTPLDDRFNAAIQASDYWTAAEILDTIPERGEEAESKRRSFRSMIKAINHKDSELQSGTVLVSKGVNVTDKLEPENYTQDPTDDGTGIS